MSTKAAPRLHMDGPAEPLAQHRWIFGVYALPLIGLALVILVFATGLTMDPRKIPSVLIGKNVPQFALSPVPGRTLGLSSQDLKGRVSLVNVFASWCAACRQEHPLLMKLSKRGIVPIQGLNYKDKPEDAQRWLAGLGDPYTRTGTDVTGRVAKDWGVYGVPETFVVDKEGRIAYRQIGVITQKILDEKILPLVRRLRGGTEPG